jgi:uncharacterized membrane protein YdjX (TVP38/TMEM64 family)
MNGAHQAPRGNDPSDCSEDRPDPGAAKEDAPRPFDQTARDDAGDPMTDMTPAEAPARRRLSLRRLAPLAAIALGAALGLWAFGDYLSFDALAENRDRLLAWRDANYAGAALTFVAVYVIVTAFSIPGAVWLTLAGGFLFGTVAATAYVVVGATAGATAIFLAAKTGLGDALRARATGWLRRLEDGFQENAVSFMLALRLVPVVPFFVANVAPAFLGVPARTYVWTTFVGIIPGAAVYASVGAGLGAVFAEGGRPDLGILFEWSVLGPLLGLAALSLLPAAVRLIRRRA